MLNWLRSLFLRGIGFRGQLVSEDVLDDSELLIAELRVIQALDADGNIHVYDVSQSSDGSDLEPAKALELIEWARAAVLAPMVYSMIQAFGEAVEGDG